MHGVVLVEVSQSAPIPEELPLFQDGLPVSYFTVNDFCDLIQRLRTIPEIEAYLEARRTLPTDTLRSVGKERSLYEFYLLNNETFAGCIGPDDARLVAIARAEELRTAINRKGEADRYARLLEHVADSLADRHPKLAFP